jgi:WD40 repeat protein
MNQLTIRVGELAVLLLAASFAFALTGCAARGWKDPVAVAPRLTIENAGQHFRSIVYSSDGSRLLVGQWPRPRIWDARTGLEGPILEGCDEPARTEAQDNRPAVFSPDDKLVAAASYGEVFLVDANSGKLRAKFEVSPSPNQAIAFSKDGSRLLWAGGLGRGAFGLSASEVEAHAWNLATNELEWTQRFGGAESPCLSPDGMSLAFYRRTGLFKPDEVHVWDATTRQQTEVMDDRGTRHGSVTLEFSRDGSRLCVSESGGTFIRTTANGSCLVLHESFSSGLQVPFAFSPEGRFVAEGGVDCVALTDAHTGKVLSKLWDPHSWSWTGRPRPDTLAFSPDGRFLAATMTDDRIRVWEVSQFLERSGEVPRSGTSSSEGSTGGR